MWLDLYTMHCTNCKRFLAHKKFRKGSFWQSLEVEFCEVEFWPAEPKGATACWTCSDLEGVSITAEPQLKQHCLQATELSVLQRGRKRGQPTYIELDIVKLAQAKSARRMA